MKHTIINTLQGVAIGDAFGVGIEFKSRPWILEHVHFNHIIPRTNNVWKSNGFPLDPGTYSDDTEHTIAVAEALLADAPFTADLLLEKFKHEYETDKQIKGYPRQGHGSIEHWYTGEKTIDEVRTAQSLRDDPGNAPVMRAIPITFTDRETLHDYAIINADVTHPNEAARQASLITVLTAWHFIRNQGTCETLFPFLIQELNNGDLTALLTTIDALPHPDQLTESDFVILHGVQPLPFVPWDNNIYGLPCAALKTAINVAYVMKHSTSAFDALKYSIRMGGDVDSLAAVCTGIASGTYGTDSLPQFLFEQTEGLDRMQKLGEKLYEKFFFS
jgi:ADP-ribosylglycohydrolase